jgi:hypothetical protein
MSASGEAEVALDVVVFCVAGHRFGVEARWVRSSRPAGGDAVGVCEAEALFGFPASAQLTTRRVLTIKGQAEDWELAVDGPVELCSLDIAAIHPLPDLIAARTGLCLLRALALTEDGLTSLVDLRGARRAARILRRGGQ